MIATFRITAETRDPLDYFIQISQRSVMFNRRTLNTRLRALLSRDAASRKALWAQLKVVDLARSNKSASHKFAEIYRQELWAKAGVVGGGTESLSGLGSSLRSTEIFRQELQMLIDQHRPRVFFDAPCGDFNWMRTIVFPASCTYIGGDIVPSVILDNQQKYGCGPNGASGSRVFINFDLTSDTFPRADYWLCKDCLQHLSLADVRAVLANFASSNVSIALISNHDGVVQNIDIDTGDFRHLDLTLPPFNLPKPRTVMRDTPSDDEPRFVAVWTREEVAQALALSC